MKIRNLDSIQGTVKLSRICPFCGRILLDQRLRINDLAVAAGGENAAKLLNLTVPLQELVRTKIEARRSRYGKHPRELDRRLADIDRRIENYYRAIGDGRDATTCRPHIARLETEKGEVHAEAELLRQDDYYRRALQLSLTEVERFAAAFGDDFRTLPMATQRRVLLHFIDEIRVVDREVVRVKVPFDDNGIRHLTNEVLMPEGVVA